jgi:hypothetical protein
MTNPKFQKILHKEMTRKDFLGFTALTIASLFGAFGVITELLSHAATPYTSEEAEDGSLAGSAETTTNASASQGKAVQFGGIVPSAPTSVSVSGITETTATLNWAAPSSDGGSAITGYIVSRNGVDSSGGGTYSTTVPATTYTLAFTLLVAGDAYTLSVAAINANGTGSTVTETAVLLSAGGGGTWGSSAPPTGGNVTVDFRTVSQAVDPLGVGITISTFNGNGGMANMNLSASWKQTLQNLSPGHCRIPLQYAGGNPGSSAAYAQTTGDGKTYVENIVAMGAIPYVILGGDSNGANNDNGYTTADASGLVKYFNANGGQNGGPVKYWIVGNEPDNSGILSSYVSGLPSILSAMRSAEPSIAIKISAPAVATWSNASAIQQVAEQSQPADILSYHAYNGAQFPDQSSYYDNVKTMEGYKSGLMYGCEEVNSYWEYNTGNGYSSSYFYDWHNTCFIASAAGNVLAAGGHFTQYSDSNGALGLMNDGQTDQGIPGSQGTTLPAYWGVGIWTGMNGQFKRYSSNMVKATNTFAQTSLEVWACDNGKIVVVNKDTSAHDLTINLGGTTTGTYNVWASQANNPTEKIQEVVTNASYSNSIISYAAPAQTVMSIDVT